MARVAIAAMLLGLTACGGNATIAPTPLGVPTNSPGATSPGETPNGPAPTPGTSFESPSPIFEPVEPVDVDVTLDTDKRVEALIPLEGGSITATGADGTVFTLDIPADALIAATTIGLTPVTSLSGMPFGTAAQAVQLSPDGLSLFNYATLTITPPEAMPAAEQIVFGYVGAGEDLILAAPVADSAEIKINVLHFSGNGVTRGLLADIEPERARLGGNAERRLQNEMAARLGAERQRQLLGDTSGMDVAAIEEIFAQYEEQVIKPRIAAAGESCAAGQLALQTILGYERQRQLLGMPDSEFGMQKYVELLDTVGRACVIEEFELCVEEHIIHRMIPVWLGFERQSQLLGGGGEGAIREAKDLTTKCLTFKLNFESTGTSDLGDAGYESSVEAEVILRLDPDALKITGDGELVNTDYTYRMASCNVTETTGGGTFAVFDLIYKDLPGSSPAYDSGPADFGHIADFEMKYHPGNSSENAHVVCPNRVVLDIPLPAWSTAWLATEVHEVTDEGWLERDWEINGGELFAEKEWDLTAGPITEVGTLKLHHTPGA